MQHGLRILSIGGSIGAGLFVSTGSALQEGGPGSLVRRLTQNRLEAANSHYQDPRIPDCWCYASAYHPGTG